MKTIVIGDIHGRNIWKQIVDQDFDKVIFLGDYFDSFNISIEDQVSNFREIIRFKENNREKCILLLGNHDYHLLPEVTERYSGFSEITKLQVSKDLGKYISDKTIQIVHTEGDFLFSHAGVSKTRLGETSIDEVNELFMRDPKRFGKLSPDPYGDHPTEGPLRIRPDSLYTYAIDGYTQIHGHTEVRLGIEVGEHINCDALELGEYLEINDGEVILRLV